ncbi:hypothetical protein Ddc_12382 [Ditylenchus destructor]|nr:hypothetical protein Ddc_12382 [Ditylenchus destructor]
MIILLYTWMFAIILIIFSLTIFSCDAASIDSDLYQAYQLQRRLKRSPDAAETDTTTILGIQFTKRKLAFRRMPGFGQGSRDLKSQPMACQLSKTHVETQDGKPMAYTLEGDKIQQIENMFSNLSQQTSDQLAKTGQSARVLLEDVLRSNQRLIELNRRYEIENAEKDKQLADQKLQNLKDAQEKRQLAGENATLRESERTVRGQFWQVEKKLSADLEAARGKINGLKVAIRHVEEARVELQGRVVGAGRLEERLRSEIQGLERKSDVKYATRLELELEEKRRTHSEIQEAKKSLEKQLEFQSATIQSLSKQVEEFQKENFKVHEAKGKAEGEKEILTQFISQLDSTIKGMAADQTRLEIKLSKLEKQVLDLVKEKKNLQKTIDGLLAQLETVREKDTERLDRVTEKKDLEIKILTVQFETATTAIAHLNGLLEKTKEENETEKKRLEAEYAVKVAEIEKEQEKKVGEKDREMQSAKEDFEARINDLSKKNELNDEEKDRLLKRIEELEKGNKINECNRGSAWPHIKLWQWILSKGKAVQPLVMGKALSALVNSLASTNIFVAAASTFVQYLPMVAGKVIEFYNGKVGKVVGGQVSINGQTQQNS